MGNSKLKIRVFMIHRWDMANIQEKIHNLLTSNPCIDVVDKSYTASSPAEKNEYIQEYACGQMQDSDIVIVLPESKEDFLPSFKEGDDYLPFMSCQPFADNHDLHSNSVYITELKTLMYDSCNQVPVLVLGWSRKSAEYLANILRNPKDMNMFYDPERIYTMGMDKVNADSLSKKVMEILKVRNVKFP